MLDEAQAIKNAATESAKAARLLRGRHRLALSGTPVENHLGELWSLFEFLNPGMLGAASVFKLAGGGARNPERRNAPAAGAGAAAVHPAPHQGAGGARAAAKDGADHLLRAGAGASASATTNCARTTATRCCRRIETQGLAKSKIQVLEALLRLRQAACHPGLLDAKRLRRIQRQAGRPAGTAARSRGRGHKALVFSQFTSLLAIVRDAAGRGRRGRTNISTARPRDRQAQVERFQNDPDCRLFLISLKAGGLGLNLTAAEYVFLLDPWWNPAVEAQAIDRAHRIGQTRPVFAYRLIARDTVEEKVLQLQKREARPGRGDHQPGQQRDPQSAARGSGIAAVVREGRTS